MWKQWRETLSRRASLEHDENVAGSDMGLQSRRASRRRSSIDLGDRSKPALGWLQSLPDDAFLSIFNLLDHASLHAFELASHVARNAMQSALYWRISVADKLAFYEDTSATTTTRLARWKTMHCLKQRHSGFPSDTLLTGTLINDSPNAFSVPPTWLLFKSRCWYWMEKLLLKSPQADIEDAAMYVRQLHCGCGYHVPCFWSSGGSLSEDTVSSIDFSVRGECFVSSIHIVPYQAYWIQDNPSFAPKQVSFTLLNQSQATPVVWYQSPPFSVKNAMTLQRFELPKTVWVSAHCVLRVNLIGRTQRGPMDERPWIPPQVNTHATAKEHEDARIDQYYYCCLSYVNATGFVVQQDTKKTKRWWQPSLHR